jgi:hypothetical protein
MNIKYKAFTAIDLHEEFLAVSRVNQLEEPEKYPQLQRIMLPDELLKKVDRSQVSDYVCEVLVTSETDGALMYDSEFAHGYLKNFLSKKQMPRRTLKLDSLSFIFKVIKRCFDQAPLDLIADLGKRNLKRYVC